MKFWWYLFLIIIILIESSILAIEIKQQSQNGQQNSPQFRTELFPEQLQQQKLQFRQAEIQTEIQNLQKLVQVTTGAQAEELLQKQKELNVETVKLQAEILRLQNEIQRRLAGLNVDDGSAIIVQQKQEQSNNTDQQQTTTPVIITTTPSTTTEKIQENQTTEIPVAKRQEIPQEDVVLPCETSTGEEGLCKPLIKCLAFYADVPELRKQPCPLRRNEQGVCCPTKKRPVPARSSSGVLSAPPPPRVEIPQLSNRQLNQAGKKAIQALEDRIIFLHELFKTGITVQPGTAAAWHQEFFPTTNQTLAQGDEAQKSIEASSALVNEFNLSPDQGTFALPRFSLLSTVLADTCPRFSNCVPTKYRFPDGSCNNLQRPDWGMAGTALQRILPPKYADGVNAPRTHGSDRIELPSARLVSIRFMQDIERSSRNFTMMVTQWGQFLDHDLTHTPLSRGEGGAGISCCQDGQMIPERFRHPDCFPILLPIRDHIFSNFGDRCMEFARSLPAPRPECNFGPREQMNQVTGYLDGSNIYGSRFDTARNLRFFRGGELRAQNVRGRAYLPANPNECTDRTNTRACFEAGDGRVNEQVNLALVHTIWLREHNRLARILSQLNPNWSDEALYQEAKRIVVAEIQHITYNEFLPLLLGQEYMDKSSLTPRDRGWTQLYDRNLNGGITNVFATVAFRYGHSQLQSFLHGYGRFGNIRANLELSKQHFAPFILYNEGAVDDFIRGLSAQPSQEVDRFFSNQITDHLFQGDLDLGLDLVALNIQRGRDHGIPPYNDWREVCGLPRARTWADLEAQMDPSTIRILSTLYSNVDEIDLYAGGVGERPKPGAILGPTFVCLVGDQFARLRRADRFFYEEANQPSTFSERQLLEIRKTSLARVLCDNSDDIALMQPLAFIQPSFLNQRVACRSQSIPSMDLRAWINERPGVN